MKTPYPGGNELAVLANAIAVALADRLDLEGQNVFGNLITLVGASLLSIAAVNQANQSAIEAADKKSSEDGTPGKKGSAVAPSKEGDSGGTEKSPIR